jgi:3-hydroxybutyryl-CoA dehydrogenase
MGAEGGNALGFARFRLGRCEPTPLVELVVQPQTNADAIEGATQLLAQFDLSVSLCRDAPGRIVDRLIRPFLNDALTRLDAGLGTAEEIDRILCLGLGYPKGPFALLEEAGLADHYEICSALHAMLGEQAMLPARRAQVAVRKADGRRSIEADV